MTTCHGSRRERSRLGLLVGAVALVAAACGSGATATGSAQATGPSPVTPPPTSQPSASSSAVPSATPVASSPAPSRNTDPDFEGTKVAFDPANFVDPRLSSNPYHPLTPGLQWVRGGTTKVGSRVVPHEIITTMTDVIRIIDGVPTIAMLDESTDSGEVSQVGMDYLALDKDGNVWILGGYTEEFEGGEYTNTESAWLGTANGQAIGILAPAHVDMNTERWFIAAAPDEAGSVGEPVQIGVSECVAFGCFDSVRVIQEGEVGAPDNENKSYAPGVGVINNVPLDASLHKDRFELLNFIELSPAGLAEASQTVLDLEKHARKTAPDVFGSAPPSKRAGS